MTELTKLNAIRDYIDYRMEAIEQARLDNENLIQELSGVNDVKATCKRARASRENEQYDATWLELRNMQKKLAEIMNE